MADEGPLIALVGSAIPRDDQGDRVVDPAREAKIRTACQALGRALATAGCRLIVYSSDPFFIEPDVVAGYAEIAAKTSGYIRFVRPENDHKNFAEQDNEHTQPLFHVRRDSSGDWEVSFYQSLEQADGVLLVCGGNSTLIAGHVAMILGRPIAPIGAFGGMARKLRNHLLHVHPNLPQSEQQALSEFDSSDAAVSIVAGLKRRCEEIAAAKRQKDEEVQRLAAADQAAQQELARLKNAAEMRRRVLWGTGVFGVISLVLIAIGVGVHVSGFLSYALIMVVLAAGGGVGACLRLTRSTGEGDPQTAMVVGPIAGALCSLSYMLPNWMSKPESFELGTTPGARLWLVMTWIVAVGGGLAADAVIDSLRRGAEKRAQEPNPARAVAGGALAAAAGASPVAAGASSAATVSPAGPAAAAAPDGRQKSAG